MARGDQGRGTAPDRLNAEVARLFRLYEGKYRATKITADLCDTAWRVDEDTVAAMMRELGLPAL
jgi:hypothetical protein